MEETVIAYITLSIFWLVFYVALVVYATYRETDISKGPFTLGELMAATWQYRSPKSGKRPLNATSLVFASVFWPIFFIFVSFTIALELLIWLTHQILSIELNRKAKRKNEGLELEEDDNSEAPSDGTQLWQLFDNDRH